ncbi:MAG: ABC transporter ATP-binding protein [Desulfobacterota bacterium]|nr:ABC transporter ATP-binding protein [Thermodesulfobacteriota bacterium]MDW8001319.1 ABC transporter ATP-binding protein [Deltaproteobacteria bacterium]
MLEVKKIEVYYEVIKAIDQLSISVGRLETVAIIGANGAGKTTLLRTIAGLIKPKTGDITFEGKSIVNLKPYEIVKRGIVMVPEGRRVFSNLTVFENLDLGGYLIKDKKKKSELLEIVLTTFPRLRERLKQLAGTLSGGEQQMLAIGRALMGSPKVLLLDEPSMGLSPVITEEIFSLLKKIQRESEISIVLVEQNAHIALDVSKRVYILENGRVFMEGVSSELKTNPKVVEAYLGL